MSIINEKANPKAFAQARMTLGALRQKYLYGPQEFKTFCIERYDRGVIFYRVPHNWAEEDLFPHVLATTRHEMEVIFQQAEKLKSCNLEADYC
jgi:hypothetical protein